MSYPETTTFFFSRACLCRLTLCCRGAFVVTSTPSRIRSARETTSSTFSAVIPWSCTSRVAYGLISFIRSAKTAALLRPTSCSRALWRFMLATS